MAAKTKPTHTQLGGFVETNPKADDGVVNDSLGTIDVADSTGSDPEKETGDAKKNNVKIERRLNISFAGFVAVCLFAATLAGAKTSPLPHAVRRYLRSVLIQQTR